VHGARRPWPARRGAGARVRARSAGVVERHAPRGPPPARVPLASLVAGRVVRGARRGTVELGRKRWLRFPDRLQAFVRRTFAPLSGAMARRVPRGPARAGGGSGAVVVALRPGARGERGKVASLATAAVRHPLSVTAWGSDLLRAVHALKRARSRFVLERADLVLADAENLARAARDLGAPAARVHCIPWGVDLTRYDAAAPREPGLLV